jgi:hypothetical protein
MERGNNYERVRNTVVEELVQIFRPEGIFLCLLNFIYLSLAIAAICVLALNWNTSCNLLLQFWLLIETFWIALYIVVSTLEYYIYSNEYLNQIRKTLINLKIGIMMICASIILYITTNDCRHESSAFWWMILAIILIQSCQICLIPVLLFLFTCLCLPCLLCIVRRFINARMEHIQNLPVHIHTHTHNSEEDPCSICYSGYELGESIKTLPCGHIYHVACIDEWLHIRNICPMCRQPIDQEPP